MGCASPGQIPHPPIATSKVQGLWFYTEISMYVFVPSMLGQRCIAFDWMMIQCLSRLEMLASYIRCTPIYQRY